MSAVPEKGEGSMQLRSAARTHVGMRRQANEDRYAQAPERGFFLVADGMGGHQAGQVASSLASETAMESIECPEDPEAPLAERLRQAVAQANREIYATGQSKPELSGMGTTFVGLLFEDNRLALSHVGDSRAYLLRSDRLRGLTDDHSVVGELLRRQEISEQDARAHPHRHVLTRALGVRSEIEPDLAEMTPAPGDVFLLCSDGLTTHVDDVEIATVLACTPDLAEAADQLVDRANRAGGQDNITVLLVRVEE